MCALASCYNFITAFKTCALMWLPVYLMKLQVNELSLILWFTPESASVVNLWGGTNSLIGYWWTRFAGEQVGGSLRTGSFSSFWSATNFESASRCLDPYRTHRLFVRFVAYSLHTHTEFVVGDRGGDGRLCSTNRYRKMGLPKCHYVRNLPPQVWRSGP